jgi:hypothetical protein
MRSLGRNATLAAAVALLASQACSKTDPDPGEALNAMPDMPAGNESPDMPATDPPSDDGSGTAEGGASSVEGTVEGNPEPDMLADSEDPNEGVGGDPMNGMEVVDDTPMFEQDDPNLIPPDSSYERVEIPVDVTNVMAIDIDDQDRVYVLERAGALKVWYPGEGRVVDAGTIPVFSGNEDGALSITLHPSFSTNGWAYILYSSAEGPGQILSRFDIVDDRINFDSESVMLRIPEEREERYHVAGGTDFDSQGNLYIASGDNTDPFGSDGFSPHDERGGRRIWASPPPVKPSA